MTDEQTKRPFLGDHKKSTTELLNDIRSIAGKSRDEFNYFMQRNQSILKMCLEIVGKKSRYLNSLKLLEFLNRICTN